MIVSAEKGLVYNQRYNYARPKESWSIIRDIIMADPIVISV